MFLVIDGGTTNLRVTLLDEKLKPVDAVKEDGGVRHTAVDGNNDYLKKTLKACIDRLLARNGLNAGDVKKCVAYGMLFPGELELEHQANESIDVANFVKAARIYAYAIVALCA